MNGGRKAWAIVRAVVNAVWFGVGFGYLVETVIEMASGRADTLYVLQSLGFALGVLLVAYFGIKKGTPSFTK